MSTAKDTILKEISEKFQVGLTYTGKNVKTILESVSLDSLKTVTAPSKIKKGDTFIHMVANGKARPCIVIKVLKGDRIVYIPLTSTKNIHTLNSYKSRFFGEGYFANHVSICTTDYVRKQFVGIFDNTRALNLAIKEINQFYKGILW